jgi:hypothetical protein
VFQQFLNLLPRELGTIGLIVAGAAAIAGIWLWFSGARHSRAIVTLLGVTMGTCVGMKLPKWCDWSIDPMAPAVGLAVILGLATFALHRFWVGLCLGLLIAGWLALGLWKPITHDNSWQPPTYHQSQTLPKYLSDVWDDLPNEMHKSMPYIGIGGLIAGVAISMILPKLGTLLLWSAAGTTMVFAAAAMLANRFSPDSLSRIPEKFSPQLAILAVTIILGSLIQWRFTSRFFKKPAQPSPEPQETAH